MNNTISNSLGISTPAEITPPVNKTSNIIIPAPKTDKEADIAHVRDQLYDITMKGGGALADLIDLAKSSQDFHFYDSLSKLITSVTNANIQLANLNEIDKNSDKTTQEKATNNNTMNFIGTSSDFIDGVLKKIQEKQDENKE